MTEKFIPPHGGYEKLLSFQKARIVYDGTVWFCKHYLDKRDRTYDQMIQRRDPANRISSKAVRLPGLPRQPR